MIRGILLAAALVSTGAHADCTKPVQASEPGINPESATDAYVTALDAYGACLRAEAPSLPPLQQVAALKAANATYAEMQRAVDTYNATLGGDTSPP